MKITLWDLWKWRTCSELFYGNVTLHGGAFLLSRKNIKTSTSCFCSLHINMALKLKKVGYLFTWKMSFSVNAYWELNYMLFLFKIFNIFLNNEKMDIETKLIWKGQRIFLKYFFIKISLKYLESPQLLSQTSLQINYFINTILCHATFLMLHLKLSHIHFITAYFILQYSFSNHDMGFQHF